MNVSGCGGIDLKNFKLACYSLAIAIAFVVMLLAIVTIADILKMSNNFLAVLIVAVCGLVIPLAVLIYAAAKLLNADDHSASALWSVNWTDILIVTLTSFSVELAIIAFNHTGFGFSEAGFQGLVIGILADIYYNIKTN